MSPAGAALYGDNPATLCQTGSVGMGDGFRLRMAFALDVVGYGARTVLQEQQVERRLQRLVDATLSECGLKLGPEIVEHRWTGHGIQRGLPVDIATTVILPRA